MLARRCKYIVAWGVLWALSAPISAEAAETGSSLQNRLGWSHPARQASAHTIQASMLSYAHTRRGVAAIRYSPRHSQGGNVLQCVPFARENSGIELIGNAVTWWNSAAGVYERGSRPEVGSVLNFRATGRMVLGHVAVVSKVIDSRNVEIDQANWSGRGQISRNIDVVDVSPRNDWTAVRVAIGNTEVFGNVYPTFGFIYDRPDRGTMVAHSSSAPVPALNPATRDLRPAGERSLVGLGSVQEEEVAEAPDAAQPHHRTTSAARSRPATAAKPFRSGITRNVGTRSGPVIKATPGHRIRHQS